MRRLPRSASRRRSTGPYAIFSALSTLSTLSSLSLLEELGIIRAILACAMITLTIWHGLQLAVMVRASLDYAGRSKLLFFALGVFIFAGAWLLTWGKTAFLRTSIHERTHALVFAIFGHSVREMYISADYSGHGHVVTQGPASGIATTIGTLAPYCLPYIVLLYLLGLPFIKPELYQVYFFGLGAPVSLHILISISDYIKGLQGGQESDIHKVGVVFATISIIFVNLIVYGAVLSVVMGGLPWATFFLTTGGRWAWWVLGS